MAPYSKKTLARFFIWWFGELKTHQYTVFTRSDAAATIYFIAQFGAMSIRERRLIESGIYWYQWTWPSSPDHSHIFNVHGGSGDGEKSDPFVDIEEDEDRLEDNELLDDC